MRKNWPRARLSELLTPISRSEVVDPTVTYSILGARWYAKGLYTKDVLLGSGIQSKYVYRVRRGDFVYNRLFGWKGSFAIATEQNDGCYVSNEFPCFEIKRESLDEGYLWGYFSLPTVWDEILGLSTGGTPTSRNRLKEERLLAMELPLPSVAEQREVAGRIKALAGRIHEARTLRGQAVEETKVLSASTTRSLLAASKSKGSQLITVENCCEVIIDYRGRTPPISEFGIPHLTSANIKNGRIDWNTSKFVTEDVYRDYMTRGIPEPGDVIFTMEAPLGDAAVVPDKRKFSLAQRTLLLRPDRSLVEPRFLARVLTSPDVREDIYAKATGTTVKGIASKRLKQVLLPIPALVTQQQIITHLDEIQGKTNVLDILQAETSAELDALMPSILDRAFRGEL
jgi:type I restriction enzyme S subunit